MRPHVAGGNVTLGRIPPADASPTQRRIVGMRVDATSYDDATARVLAWARERAPRYLCVSTVHMVMEAHDDADYRATVNGADLVAPDGMPLVWGLRLLGVRDATRVHGPHLMPIVCERAAREGLPIALIGSTPATLDLLQRRLREQFPALAIALAFSPPFRDAAPGEDDALAERIAASGARIVFVGLGCPKQERWMGRMRGRIAAPMIGVGAAFDFGAGTKRMAPDALQRAGLEWLYRLLSEPRRLWRRYLYHNPRFVALFTAQLVREAFRHRADDAIARAGASKA